MSADDPVLAIAMAEPCAVGTPLLHRLVDGELPVHQTRAAAEHAQSCPACRDHLRWLELERQAVREVAAPAPHRFVELWGDRMRLKLVAAITEEAGAQLLRAATSGARNRWTRARHYLRQLATWLERDDLKPVCGAPPATILDGFAALLGREWPPLIAARDAVNAGSARSEDPRAARAAAAGPSRPA